MSGKLLTDQSFDNLSIVIPIGPDDKAWYELLKELAIFGKDLEVILSACKTPPIDIDFPPPAT